MFYAEASLAVCCDMAGYTEFCGFTQRASRRSCAFILLIRQLCGQLPPSPHAVRLVPCADVLVLWHSPECPATKL